MHNVGIEYPARGQAGFCQLGEPPAPGPGEVLLRTRLSALTNGTERHALLAEHLWSVFPSRHGYQHVGEVAAVGPGVHDFVPGERVFFGHYVGHRAWHLVKTDAPHLCLKLPDDVDDEDAVLFGVAGVALRGARRCRVGLAQPVWVVGQGLIGQCAAQAARALGACVTVTDVDPRRLELARSLGAHRVLDARDPATPAQLQAAGPFHRILDCSGWEGLLPQVAAQRLLAPGGAIGLLAVRGQVCFPWNMLHGATEGSLEVSCHFSLDDLLVLLHFVRGGVIRTRPLITHRVPVARAPEIYATLRDHPAELLGVVFHWRE